MDDVQAELARLKAENEALKRQQASPFSLKVERCSPGPRRMVASRPSALKGPAATASACPVRSAARVIGSWK